MNKKLFQCIKVVGGWLLVDHENKPLFLFDEPPPDVLGFRLDLWDYIERVIEEERERDELVPHNLPFFRMPERDQKKATIRVIKTIAKYYDI